MRALVLAIVAGAPACAEEAVVLWSAEVKGDQIATPVVADGTVFVVARRTPPPDGGSEGWLFALDGETGKPTWTVSLQSALLPPAVDSGVVVALEGDVTLDGDTTQVVALEAASGKKLWSAFAAGVKGEYWTPRAPAASDGRVYFLRGKKLIAADIRTGKEAWIVETPGRAAAAPLVAGGRVCVWTDKDALTIDAATGKIVHSNSIGDEPIAEIALGSGAACILFKRGTVFAYDLESMDSRWTAPASKLRSGLVIEDGLVQAFGEDGRLHGLSLASGKETRSVEVHGTLRGGRVTSVDADGKIVARAANDGSQLWTWGAPARPVTAVTTGTGAVCVGCADQKVYALREPGAK